MPVLKTLSNCVLNKRLCISSLVLNRVGNIRAFLLPFFVLNRLLNSKLQNRAARIITSSKYDVSLDELSSPFFFRLFF